MKCGNCKAFQLLAWSYASRGVCSAVFEERILARRYLCEVLDRQYAGEGICSAVCGKGYLIGSM